MTTHPDVVGPFPDDALEANRAGRLTDAQRKALAPVAQSSRGNERQIALVAAVFGLILLFLVKADTSPLLRFGGAAACFLVAAFFLVRSMPNEDPITRDIRAGRVENVEGATLKRRFTSHGTHGSSMTSYYLDLAGRSFEVSGKTYEAMPDGGMFRVFFLPQSHHVVNIERLPDVALPAGALDNPASSLKALGGALFSHDRQDKAEHMAQLAAMEHQMEGRMADLESQVKAANVPPPATAEADPRPLAEAVVGTWSLGPIKLRFDADGTLTTTPPFGKPRTGTWKVRADGRLEGGIMGQDAAVEARVVGSSLTITPLKGETMTFTRIPG